MVTRTDPVGRSASSEVGVGGVETVDDGIADSTVGEGPALAGGEAAGAAVLVGA
jgi:hypothetical protein